MYTPDQISYFQKQRADILDRPAEDVTDAIRAAVAELDRKIATQAMPQEALAKAGAVRAKMRLISSKEYDGSGDARELEFSAVYDQTIPEDQRFAKASPSGSLRILVANPAALALFQVGGSYYLNFTPVTEQPVVAPAPEVVKPEPAPAS